MSAAVLVGKQTSNGLNSFTSVYTPAEARVGVLEENARVALRLQHLVPVKVVVPLQRAFEILKHNFIFF